MYHGALDGIGEDLGAFAHERSRGEETIVLILARVIHEIDGESAGISLGHYDEA